MGWWLIKSGNQWNNGKTRLKVLDNLNLSNVIQPYKGITCSGGECTSEATYSITLSVNKRKASSAIALSSSWQRNTFARWVLKLVIINKWQCPVARQAAKKPKHTSEMKKFRKDSEWWEKKKREKTITFSAFEEPSIRQISSWRASSFKASRISLEEAAAKIQSF